MSSRVLRPVRIAGVVLAAALASTACGADGLGELPLPLRAGTGDGSYQVTVDLTEIANLVPNAEVLVNDVPVGSVTDMEVVDWHARLTVSLDGDVVLPANATARVAQKSLLGAEYLELAAPVTEPAQGTLADGDVIPLARTSRYPETEELLGALSVVLNGSGLQQVRTITTELNAVFDGRQTDVRALVGNLQTFVGGLDAQRDDIVRAIDALDRFSATVNRDNETLAAGLDTVPDALRVLNEDRDALIGTFERVGRLGDATGELVDDARDDLLANLRQIRPAVQKLADAGDDLTEGLELLLTFPFPASTAFPGIFRGDYGNLFLVLDLSPEVLRKNFAIGFDAPVESGLDVLAVPPLGRDQDLATPLAPFADELDVPLETALEDVPGAPLDDTGGLAEKGTDTVRGLLGGGR